jgi:hypothetical protein
MVYDKNDVTRKNVMRILSKTFSKKHKKFVFNQKRFHKNIKNLCSVKNEVN